MRSPIKIIASRLTREELPLPDWEIGRPVLGKSVPNLADLSPKRLLELVNSLDNLFHGLRNVLCGVESSEPKTQATPGLVGRESNRLQYMAWLCGCRRTCRSAADCQPLKLHLDCFAIETWKGDHQVMGKPYSLAVGISSIKCGAAKLRLRELVNKL